MNLDQIRAFCLAKPGVTAEHPFGPDTLVLKVMNKMFALTSETAQPEFINLKGDLEDNLAFREQFEGVKPGYHMNKEHWNSVYFGSDVPEGLIREMINDSYDLIVASLPKKVREALEALP
jgi:predicted DNA-binding protein (MmcQ/YjbR family)